MITDFKIVNKPEKVKKIPLKKLILEDFTKENGKQFYSIEVTPRADLIIDFNEFKTSPLFVDITWLSNENLREKSVRESSAFQLAKQIESSHVVNSVTCFNLNEGHLDEILGGSEVIKNFTVLRGGK